MRRAAVAIHLWLGLIVGALWALQGLTGAALVLHREADRLTSPAYAASVSGPWRPLDALIAAAGARAGRVTAVDARGDAVAVHYARPGGEKRAAIVEAATGRVLGDRAVQRPRPAGEGFWRWVYALHHDLLAGDAGEIVQTVAAALLVTGTLLGVWIAAPWRRLAAVGRWRNRRLRAWGWHRLVGVLTLAAVLPLALTGLYLVWGKELRGALGTVVAMESPPAGKTALAAGAVVVPAEAAWRIAQAEFPGAAFTSVALPGAKSAAYQFRLRQAGETRAVFGTTAVWVDAVSGRVVWRYDALRAPAANRVVDAMFSVHSGEIAGWPGRIAVLAAGLALPALWGTGVWLWVLKRRPQPRRLLLGGGSRSDASKAADSPQRPAGEAAGLARRTRPTSRLSRPLPFS